VSKRTVITHFTAGEVEAILAAWLKEHGHPFDSIIFKTRQRLEGHGSMETNIVEFDGTTVTYTEK